MPVRIDPDGRRSVQAEVEAPGTPEEVWQAIASGPGISAWFVPTEVDGRVGGAVTASFGPGMDSLSTITAWEPPHRFVAESRDDMGPDDPTVATEWTVEARAGGACVVRVVHSWFTESSAWDDQFEGHTYGWLSAFRILRLYLTHFEGMPSALVQVVGATSEPKEAAWDRLVRPLGLAGAAVGDHVRAPHGAPPLAGVVAWAGQPGWTEEFLIVLAEPAPGIASLFPLPMGDQVLLMIRLFLYGADATSAVAAAEPAWQAWVQELFAGEIAVAHN